MSLRAILAGIAALRSSQRAFPAAVVSSRALSTTGAALQGIGADPRLSAVDMEHDLSSGRLAHSAVKGSGLAVGNTPRPTTTVTDNTPIGARYPQWPTLAPLATRQKLDDARNVEYAPKLTTDFESIPELGRLTLGDLIEVGQYTALFAVKEYPDLVIEYELKPVGHGSVLHGLVKDYWFRTELARSGLVDRPLFISPAAITYSPKERGSIKTKAMALSANDSYLCAVGGGLVRFTVKKRTGKCLRHAHPVPAIPGSGLMPIHQAAAIGVQVIQLVARMHEVGIMHGNIHEHTVCYIAPESPKLTLTNFRHSKWTAWESDKKKPIGVLEPSLGMSPWQLEGSHSARRDDLFMTLELVAALIVGPGMYKTAFPAFDLGIESFKKWKLNLVPTLKRFGGDRIDELGFLTKAQKDSVIAEFAEAMKSVLALDSVKTPIDYAKIITHLRNIEDLSSPPRSE